MKITLSQDAAFSRVHGIFLVFLALLMFEIGSQYSEKSAPAKTPPRPTNVVIVVTQQLVDVVSTRTQPRSLVPLEPAPPLVTNRPIVRPRPVKPAQPVAAGPHGQSSAVGLMHNDQSTRQQPVTFSNRAPVNAVRVALP